MHPYCPFDYTASIRQWFFLSTIRTFSVHTQFLLWSLQERLQPGTGHILMQEVHNCGHLALVISFALMEVALVFFLFVCKLTVTTGKLSGLLFYAIIKWQ